MPSEDVASDTYLEESGGRRLRRGGKRGHHGRQATAWGSPLPEDPQITSTPPSASPPEDVAGDAFPEDNGRHLQRRERRGGRRGGRQGGKRGRRVQENESFMPLVNGIPGTSPFPVGGGHMPYCPSGTMAQYFGGSCVVW